MSNEHPFQSLFESLGRLPLAHAEAVNRQAYEILHDVLTVPIGKPGRCILLRAPRAGHGKTHLLSRIQHELGASHEFIPLRAAFGCQIDARTVTNDALRRLLRPLPAAGGLCVLDGVTRGLLALALEPMVLSGEAPCQDKEAALASLRTRPMEAFDFHHSEAGTAKWTRENFGMLSQRFSVELAQACDQPILEVAFWVHALFRFVSTPAENPTRLRLLAEEIHSGNPTDAVWMARLQALLGLLSLRLRVVLVADHLDGFSSNEAAALNLAAFLADLRQSVERLDVILSLNQDVWQSAFLPRLSGGLADRLTEVLIELTPLTEAEMVALLESRVPGVGARLLARIDRAAAGTHARGLVRAAGIAWLKATAMNPPAPVNLTNAPSLPSPVARAAPPEVAISPALANLSNAPVLPSPVVRVTPPAVAVSPPPVILTNTPALPTPVVRPASPEVAIPAPPVTPTQTAVSEEKTAPPTIPPVEGSAPSSAPDSERVDILLKQFLERYGRNPD